MPLSAPGMRPKVGKGCSQSFEGSVSKGVARGLLIVEGLNEGLQDGDCQLRTAGRGLLRRWPDSPELGEGARIGVEDATRALRSPRGTRSPRRRREGLPSPAKAGGRLLTTPWRGLGAASGVEGWGTGSAAGREGGRGSRGCETRGLRVKAGAAGRGGRASGARACGGCTSENSRLGAKAAGNRGEGAPRLRGETGWSEVLWAAWAGSA